MDSNPQLLFAIFIACMIVWQLAAGYTLGPRGRFRADVFREHNPKQYWLTILVHTVVLVIFLITGTTSWEWSSSSDEDAEILYWRGMAHGRPGDLAAARADVARACELGKAEACNVAERLRAKL